MDKRQQKELLIALCGYLPYGIICDRPSGNSVITNIYFDKEYNDWVAYNEEGLGGSITLEKPYLRPMDSMTAEEKQHYRFLMREMELYGTHGTKLDDWLNKWKFDHRGLISKGLAMPAPDGMYDTYKFFPTESYNYFPPEFETYAEYVEYLKSKGLAAEAPQ